MPTQSQLHRLVHIHLAAKPSTQAQVSYAKHLLDQAVRAGHLNEEDVPADDRLKAMDQASLSALIEGLRSRRGKPEFYGNGRFKGWKRASQQWMVYLFSETGEVLFSRPFLAVDQRDAERKGLAFVKPELRKHPEAEDWVVEPVSKQAKVISPDTYLYTETGKYVWTPERVKDAWQKTYTELNSSLKDPRIAKVVLLIGIPASGKSTWVQANHEPDAVYIDATFVRTSWRKPVIDRVKAAGKRVEAVVLDTPINVCLDRNACRPPDRRIPEARVMEMALDLQQDMPKAAEGFDKITHVRTASYINDIDNLPGAGSVVTRIELPEIDGGPAIIETDDGGEIAFHVDWPDDVQESSMPVENAATRIALRYVIARPGQTLPEVLRNLEFLNALAENIEEVTHTFNLHYRAAAAPSTEVKSQFDAMRKAGVGLDAAKAVRDNVKKLIAQFPDDKTAARALKDAETMVSRYVKIYNDASAMIQKITKGEMPVALKKLGDTIAKLIRAQLVDPKSLQVLHWQSDVMRDAHFEVIFRIQPGPGRQPIEVKIAETTGRETGPVFHHPRTGQIISPVVPKQVVETFLTMLQGWDGLKGEGAKNQGRRDVTNRITAVLKQYVKYLDSDGKVESFDGGMALSISFRGDTRWESYSEWDQDEKIPEESRKIVASVSKLIGSDMAYVAKVTAQYEEKGWWTISVRLK